MIDILEQKLREKACLEFRVNVADIFKRGKPSEMRRKVEKRIEELRLLTQPLNFDEYAKTVEIPPKKEDDEEPPVKRKRGRPPKNPVAESSLVVEEDIKEEIHEVVENRVNDNEKAKYHASRMANPNPPPLHQIENLKSFKFSVKNDVPVFLKKKA